MKKLVWIYLLFSLLFEVAGDIFVKFSSNLLNNKLFFSIMTFVCYNIMLLFWFLAVKIDKNITITGTIWLMGGELLLVILGAFFFKEAITMKQYVGIAFSMIALFLMS